MTLTEMATDCCRAVHCGEWVASYIKYRLTDPSYQENPSLAHDAMAYRQARTAARCGNRVLDYLDGFVRLHDWRVDEFSLDKWRFCRICGVVERRDGSNKPCKGPAQMRPLEPYDGNSKPGDI